MPRVPRAGRVRAASAPCYGAVSMPAEPPEGYISSADACKALGISDRTLRRRVQAGTIAGEYIARPQGSVLYIKPPEGYTADEAAPDTAPDGVPRKPEEIAEDIRGNQAALAVLLLERIDTAQAALLAATERAVLAEGERDAARQAAETARELAAEIRAQRDDLARRLAEAERRASRPWWRFWK